MHRFVQFSIQLNLFYLPTTIFSHLSVCFCSAGFRLFSFPFMFCVTCFFLVSLYRIVIFQCVYLWVDACYDITIQLTLFSMAQFYRFLCCQGCLHTFDFVSIKLLLFYIHSVSRLPYYVKLIIISSAKSGQFCGWGDSGEENRAIEVSRRFGEGLENNIISIEVRQTRLLH